MNKPYADNDLDTPSSAQAAKDLRDAVENDASKIISATEQKAHQLKEAASQKAAQLRDYAENKASHLKEIASEKAHHLSGQAKESAAHLRDVAEEQWEDKRLKAGVLKAEAEDYIRDNPTQAILAAVGVGFILGLLMRR